MAGEVRNLDYQSLFQAAMSTVKGMLCVRQSIKDLEYLIQQDPDNKILPCVLGYQRQVLAYLDRIDLLLRGAQIENTGNLDTALENLEKALRANNENLEYALDMVGRLRRMTIREPPEEQNNENEII